MALWDWGYFQSLTDVQTNLLKVKLTCTNLIYTMLLVKFCNVNVNPWGTTVWLYGTVTFLVF